MSLNKETSFEDFLKNLTDGNIFPIMTKIHKQPNSNGKSYSQKEFFENLMSQTRNRDQEPQDQVVEDVRKDLLERSTLGIKKYGTTLAGNPLPLRDWLQHSYEECLDMANYLKRSIIEIDNGVHANTTSAEKLKKVIDILNTK